MRRRNFLQSSLTAAAAGLTGGDLSRLFAGGDTQQSPSKPTIVSYADLRRAFENPPIANRDWTRWWFMGPQATDDGIAYELEQMKKQGIAGVELSWLSPVEPEGNFAFLSDRWSDLTRFTVSKAAQLGMQVDFTLGTGWPYGGPWVPIELSSKCIVRVVDDVVGPDRYGVKIPGEIGEHEKLIALFAAQTVGSDKALDPATIVDLMPYLRYTDPKYWAVARQAVGWSVPEGHWKVIALKQAPTRQAVRGGAIGGEGFVIDHLSRESLNHHLDVVGGAFRKVVGDEFGKTVRAIFCDSFEIHVPHQGYFWTDRYLEEFKQRKGYDLTPHLLALWYDVGEKTPYVRHDFVHVLSQVIIDNFFVPLREWCEQNKLMSRVQSHGSIGELLQSYASNSIGEGEQVTLREPQISVHRKSATSAAHIYGKPLTSAESFTFLSAPGYPSSYRYVVNMELLKSVLDPALRDGYQEIVNCGYTYNDPDDSTEPFHEMYAVSVIRHTEPWWQYYHQFSSYIQRCCGLLSQGRFVGDVAVLSPIPDAWSKSGPSDQMYWQPEAAIQWGEIAPMIVHSGLDFNFVNDQVLQERSTVADGKLVIEGMEHRVLILPRITYISVKTMERIREFCHSGGVVIAIERIPRCSTGFSTYEDQNAKLQDIIAEMFGTIPLRDSIVRHKFGQGEAVLLRSESDLPKILREHLQPDFALEASAEAVVHLHRRTADADVYFVTNASAVEQRNSALFRTERKLIEIWNAETGESRAVMNYSVEQGGIRIPICLRPYESSFYIFRDGPEPAHVVESNCDAVIPSGSGRVICRASSNGPVYVRRGGASPKPAYIQKTVTDLPAPFEITGEWLVTFQAYRFEKLVKKMGVLHSWSTDADTRHFSGTARYELEFEVPPSLLAAGRQVTLDLGTVADASKVWLNTTAAGVTWKRPHVHDVTQVIKPGRNFLEVRVSNRLINAVGGQRRPASAQQVIDKYGSYNERQQWYEIMSREYGAENLPPAGLIGPVRLVFSQDVEFEL